jgi:hypothetical protein
MIFGKGLAMRLNPRKRTQKTLARQYSNASRKELQFYQNANEVTSSTVVMSLLDFDLVWR